MEVIHSSMDEICNKYPVFNCGGYEANILRVDETEVMKLFLRCDRVVATLPNKLQKLYKLANANVEELVKPDTIVLDENEGLIGYYMPLIEKGSEVGSYYDVMFSRRLTLRERIDYYKAMEDGVKKCHQAGIVLVDTNPENFLIDKDGKYHFIDVDNYRIGNLKHDVTPTCYAQCYQNRTGRGISKMTDIYSLTIRFLEASSLEFEPCIKSFCAMDDYLDLVSDSLDVPDKVRERIKSNLSEDGQRDYLGDTLNCLRRENGRYIKSK